jgi:hypothetical protein
MNLVTATSNGSCELIENNTAKITQTVQSINVYDNEAHLKKSCKSALVGFLACPDAVSMPILPVPVAAP